MATKLTMTAKNKAFWSKTKAQQRVQVAKDVILQIEQKFLFPDSGTYFSLRKLKGNIEAPPVKLDDVLNSVKKQDAKCYVCGIGACFVSLVRLGNSAATSDYITAPIVNRDSIGNSSMRKLLRKIFPPSQITLIECAFETHTGFKDPEDKTESYLIIGKAESFGQKYSSDKARMIAIMNNIIENKGTFIP